MRQRLLVRAPTHPRYYAGTYDVPKGANASVLSALSSALHQYQHALYAFRLQELGCTVSPWWVPSLRLGPHRVGGVGVGVGGDGACVPPSDGPCHVPTPILPPPPCQRGPSEAPTRSGAFGKRLLPQRAMVQERHVWVLGVLQHHGHLGACRHALPALPQAREHSRPQLMLFVPVGLPLLSLQPTYPWLMNYLRANDVQGGYGGYPFPQGRGLMFGPVSSAAQVEIRLNILNPGVASNQYVRPASAVFAGLRSRSCHPSCPVRPLFPPPPLPFFPHRFYLPEISGCWKLDGSPCDGDVETDITRYLCFITNPAVKADCGPKSLNACPPYHVRFDGRLVEACRCSLPLPVEYLLHLHIASPPSASVVCGLPAQRCVEERHCQLSLQLLPLVLLPAGGQTVPWLPHGDLRPVLEPQSPRGTLFCCPAIDANSMVPQPHGTRLPRLPLIPHLASCSRCCPVRSGPPTDFPPNRARAGWVTTGCGSWMPGALQPACS